MGDGINDGNPLGRPRTREELLAALEETKAFGQHRTQEVVDLTAEIARLRSALEAAERERDDLKIIVVPSLGERLTSAEAAVERLTRERDEAVTEARHTFNDGLKAVEQARRERDSAISGRVQNEARAVAAEQDLAAARAEAGASASRLAKAESVIAAVDAANDLEGVQRALDEWARALAAGKG